MSGAALSRWDWRNWPVLMKLIAVLLVPTMVALVVGVLRVVDQAGAVPGYNRISEITEVQDELSGLIGAVQRERDLATAFVADGREGDTQPLEQQFRAVANEAAEARSAADQVENLEATGYASVLDELRGLRPLRQSVLGGVGPVEVVVTEYNAAVDPLIELDAALVRQLDDVAVANDAAATHALLASREQVSRQHAVVLAALAANRIEPSQIDEVRSAAVRLGTHQKEFEAALNPDERTAYLARVAGEAELARQRILQLVLNRGQEGAELDIQRDDWSERNAVAIGEIAGVENELRQRIDQTALSLRDQAQATAAWNAVILAFALVLGVFIGIMVARSMLRPLGTLKRTALDVADRRLPAAMARIRDGDVSDETIEPVPVGSREEIGQVARAFDEVHRQAIRLASEQAQLRAHVNDIFVNLSRRSQSLVERQLQLIDRLESSEQDPEQLDNLFQLDHLATRMRRNSDNLLVLAGTESVKRASRPVRLVDVLRASVSEVEQYQRLVLKHPANVLVLGRTASDLVHLLAELLDNATQFSPPDTPVVVTSEIVPDGTMVIEVTDRGVGMTEAELVEANERLVGTPAVDASVSRRMGLFVVGRLAVRHGIGVWLRGGEDGIGVRASVSVPAHLVRPARENGDQPGPAPAAHSPSLGNGMGPEPGTRGPVDVRSIGAATPAGNGALSSGRPDQPVPPPAGIPRSAGGLPVRAIAAPGAPPEAPLFSDAEQAEQPGRAGQRFSAETPIFDDVASAWFREPDPTPGVSDDPGPDRTAPETTEQAPESRAPEEQVSEGGIPEEQAPADETPADETPKDEIPEELPSDGQGRGGPPAAPSTPSEVTDDEDWGRADDGWRAASALATVVSTEVTRAGLPRRKPRALLVPGTSGGPESAEQPANMPVRSAELVRGRLSSYQRGIREGRRARFNRGGDAGQSPQQQDAAEETT